MTEKEGAKFWLNILTELQNRGVKDILIACVDGLQGFPDAINAAFPDAKIQLCIVHMVRNSMKYVPWKDYKAVAVAADLKRIYQPVTEEALQELMYMACRMVSSGRQFTLRFGKHCPGFKAFSSVYGNI